MPNRALTPLDKLAGLLAATPKRALGVALVLGFSLRFAFAPYGLYPLAIVAPALLFILWLHMGARDAARSGYAFGLGMFGGGVSWVYYSLHDFGNMPAPMAAVMVLLFVGVLALYPALLGAMQSFIRARIARFLIFLPASWVLLEWVRGWMLSGFPWLHLGYAQIDSPLAGFAPILGVYGVSWAVLVTAACAALLLEYRRRAWPLAAMAFALWLGGAALGRIAWTVPAGAPVRAALIQANVPLAIKWQPQYRQEILQRYADLSLAQRDVDIIVWPETAVPAYLHELETTYIAQLKQRALAQNTTLVFGVIERLPGPRGQIFNSVVTLAPEGGTYRKRHLVPFGEFLPLSGMLQWLLDYLRIPMSNFSAWPEPQAPLAAAGQWLGVSICYEDAFGEEVIAALPRATLLVNVSEDAWFGDSAAPHQHLQMARMRARETERAMLRATNTGVSAIIDADGRILAGAPQFQTDVVRASVIPRNGATPFVRWGNLPVIWATLALAALSAWRAKRR